MEEFLIQLGTLSVQASIVIAVIVVLRFLFARLHISKKYMMLLWLVPYICMICPWKINMPFSFWGKGETLFSKFTRFAHSTEYALFINPESHPLAGITDGNGASVMNDVQMMTEGAPAGQAQNGVSFVETATDVIGSMTAADMMYTALFAVWLVGFLMIGAYCIFSYWKLKKRLLCSVPESENIYYADNIDTAFVIGFFKPAIYLPSTMPKEHAAYVVEHEKTHIRQHDTIKKLLSLAVTCVHWFNPIAWLAFVLMGKDMEMTCDEETVARLGMETKKDYASALLQLSAPKSFMPGAPLAFGEGNTKSRIKNIVKYKKTFRIVTVLAVVTIVVVAFGFLGRTTNITTLGSGEVEWVAFPEDRNVAVTILYNQGNETKFIVFPDSYGEELISYLEQVEVELNPITMSREEDRSADVSIRIGESSYFNFDEDMSEVWYDNGVKPTYSYKVVEPKPLREFVEAQLYNITDAEKAVATEVVSTEAGQNAGIAYEYPAIPYYEPADEVLIDATEISLDYADENIVVFHHFFGLFVYDINRQEIAGAVALEPIGCNYTQGDNYCEVVVDSAGTTVYLHPLQEKEMYVYDIGTATLTKQEYNMKGIDVFTSFDDIKEVAGWDPTVFQTTDCVPIGKDRWIYLESGSGLVQDLTVVITKDGDSGEYLKIFENYAE